MRVAWIASLLLVVSLGCGASSRPGAIPTCPNAPGFRCTTTPVCTYNDRDRCNMCRCAPPPYVPPQQLSPSPAPQPPP